MTLESQVVSLELAERLKELGVKQESLFWWHESRTNRSEKTGFESLKTGKFYLHQSKGDYSAFTVAELGEMLMDGRLTQYCFKRTAGWGWKAFTLLGTPVVMLEWSDTEADARAKMLIYLLENKFVTL